MTRFSATTTSEAVVAAERSAIWAALTDPVLLPQLTPLLQHIETDGDRWRWQLIKIPVLTVAVTPNFTEKMVFDPEHRIEYTHEPPPNRHERTGADGWYQLKDVSGGTHLAISLTLHVDLPLSRLARPAVEQVMRSTMSRTGDRFAVNLEKHLGLR